MKKILKRMIYIMIVMVMIIISWQFIYRTPSLSRRMEGLWRRMISVWEFGRNSGIYGVQAPYVMHMGFRGAFVPRIIHLYYSLFYCLSQPLYGTISYGNAA